MKLLHAVLLCVFSFCVVRADLLPLPDESALKQWGKKSNTTLTRGKAGSLTMEVRTNAFVFGWMQRPLPAQAVTPQAAGLYGRFRSAPENRAQITVTFILKDGKEPLYYSCTQGNLADSSGEWTEFYVPFAEFRHERGNAKTSRCIDD